MQLQDLEFSDQNKLLLAKILRIARPQKDWSYLDICSSGLTIPLSQMVAKTTVIEESKPKAADLLKKNRFLDVYNKKIEYLILARKFNLVLMSFALPHILNWRNAINKLVEYTQPNGYLFIAHYRQSGDYMELMKKFSPSINGKEFKQHGSLNDIVEILQETGESVNYERIDSTIVIPSVEQAIKLCELLFNKRTSYYSSRTLSILREYFESKRVNEKVLLSANIGLLWMKRGGLLQTI